MINTWQVAKPNHIPGLFYGLEDAKFSQPRPCSGGGGGGGGGGGDGGGGGEGNGGGSGGGDGGGQRGAHNFLHARTSGS